MDNIYLYMICALAFLAIADLIVGVSNDAVNFLNSAIGSKAISFKTIMIVASVGIAIGAIFSSGLMEVARKGIFNPGEFMFDQIMIIFMAVMITDILLLDFFNTLGMPTSTTVSIVFELLGASVAVALLKINNGQGNFSDIVHYINTFTATKIIFGIVLSVLVAFTIGAIVQWITRLLLSYDFQKKALWVGALFGGIALSSITYFIFIKGIKGTSYANESYAFINNLTIKVFLENNTAYILSISFIFWTLVSAGLIAFFKANIYKIIILVGTFALALAFAGNDLVNFIGVPITALKSYEVWVSSGVIAHDFSMGFLEGKVETPTYLLLIAGAIMVITLWFSNKAKEVVKTSLDLSSQTNTRERFKPNFLSRLLVRSAILTSKSANKILPKSWKEKIEKQFVQPDNFKTIKASDLPAFDLVRAAVNLMVAAVLISIATSMKLPLSTTYVTFMVAMGTSLSDRAWGAESAVYRVAGVLNVIVGWFFTALIAFIAAGIIAFLLDFNLVIMFPLLLVIAVILLVRNYILYKKRSKENKEEDALVNTENSSVQGVIHESAKNIVNVVKRSNLIYSNAIKGLAIQDLKLLKKNKKQVYKLTEEIDNLRDNIFYFIKNLDESSVGASDFYINILGHLQDMIQSLEYITNSSHKHVNNNHKKLKFNQIKELKEINKNIGIFLNDTQDAFESRSFDQIGNIISKKEFLFNLVKDKIAIQVARTRTTEESSPKNTTLYFGLLLETKDLLKVTMNLLEAYFNSHDSSVVPATLTETIKK